VSNRITAASERRHVYLGCIGELRQKESRSPPPMIASAPYRSRPFATAYVSLTPRGEDAKAAFTPAQAGVEHEYLYEPRSDGATIGGVGITSPSICAERNGFICVGSGLSSAGGWPLFVDDGQVVRTDGKALPHRRGRNVYRHRHVSPPQERQAVRLFGYATARPGEYSACSVPRGGHF